MVRNCVGGCQYVGPWKLLTQAVIDQYPNLEAKQITHVATCQHPSTSESIRVGLDVYKDKDGNCFVGNGIAQIPWNDCRAYRR